MIKSLSFVFIILNFALSAQQESSNWCFGQNAGLHFDGGSVTAFNSSISASESCASTSDQAGNLLFYTDGLTVWDRNHIVMPNGTGLMGSSSSAQVGMIPLPGSDTKYLIFTLPSFGGPFGLRYTEVDLNLNAGFGDVTAVKNVLMQYSVGEKLALVMHENLEDIWLICHTSNTNEFTSFLITSTGIDPNPVISAVGIAVDSNPNASVGYMKASLSGKKIAIAHRMNSVEIFDFDCKEGTLKNPISLTGFNSSLGGSPYGVEFSEEQNRLYVSIEEYNSPSTIIQFNLDQQSEASIQLSKTVVATSSEGTFGALQLGPDGKIYISRSNADYLGTIEFPNVIGADCGFIENSVYLNGNQSGIGLPIFMSTCGFELTMPNVFTANADGINDTFQPINIKGWVKNQRLIIFNRWGDIMYETDDLLEGWDGYSNGKLASQGTYYWQIMAKEGKNKKKLHGYVQLIR